MNTTIPGRGECPVKWCDESDAPHTTHRRYVETMLVSHETVHAVGVNVAGVGRKPSDIEVTLSNNYTETVLRLTLAEGRKLGDALISAVRRFD